MARGAADPLRKFVLCGIRDTTVESEVEATLGCALREHLQSSGLSGPCISVDTQPFLLAEELARTLLFWAGPDHSRDISLQPF
jgi:hypothetical protein